MREKIIAALQPLIDGFVDQVVLLAEQQAKSLIRERLSSLLETDVRGAGSAIPERSVPEPAVPAKQGSTSSARKPMTCSKCGAVGFTATTCGKTHNVSTSPAVGPIAIPRPAQETSPPATSSIKLVDRKPPPPTSSGSERIAAIAASAQRVDVRPSGGPPRGVSRAVRPAPEVPLTDDERDALRESGLPRAVSSFTF